MNAIGFKNDGNNVNLDNLDNVNLDNVNLDNVNTAPEEVALSGEGEGEDAKPDVQGLKRLFTYVAGGAVLAISGFVLGRLTGKNPVEAYKDELAALNEKRDSLAKAKLVVDGKKREKIVNKAQEAVLKAQAKADKARIKAEKYLTKMPEALLKELLASAGIQPATVIQMESRGADTDQGSTPSSAQSDSQDSVRLLLERIEALAVLTAKAAESADKAAEAAASAAEASASTAEATASTAEAVEAGFARTAADLAEVKDLTAKAASNADKARTSADAARAAAERAAAAKTGGAVDLSAIEKALADLGHQIENLAASPVAVDDRSSYFSGLKTGLEGQSNQLSILIREVQAVKAKLLDQGLGQGNNSEESRRLRQQVIELQQQASALKLSVERTEADLSKANKKAEAEALKAEQAYERTRKAEAQVRELTKAEVPKAEEPKAEVPKAEVPKAEVPKAEDKKADPKKKK